MQTSVSSKLRGLPLVLLVATLLTAAFLKTLPHLALFSPPSRAVESAHLSVALAEAALAVAMLVPRARSLAVLVTCWAFIGAGLASASRALLDVGWAPCGCLGPVEISQGGMLLVDGLIVVLAALVPFDGEQEPLRSIV